ncbi:MULTISPECIES: DegT/DnrJ/EryC1/StrS family aminotransferase [Fictibacillus]|uniref:Transcriptional regulator n=1 Tax=Fictibacillus enclensis TaxID=1017270 RepID=A0A0V8J7V9_9BACL|nr:MULTISPECIES: DegT/DnrJ/EryC1/StrS family aminotransferase [Fictibacillus]KSU83081.1 transcriptional regulator [Fictibacillus enclensis]RXZ01831.1 aminotransferase class V-fold PLP-dependent enzyme [Fictibacillus sp. S7]SCC09860.1 dTDP-4-amino-4,6-dideoxygalactose transaminase [Fictibacillus enclensis]
MKVPMLDLSEQYQSLKEEIFASLEEIMSGSRFILGDNVKKLEQDVADFSSAKYGVGVANGSDALHISLLGCGVKAGDEVIVPAFTFFATAGAVARAGAVPVFVDIDPKTYNIDPAKIEAAVTEKTKAIIPVHLYGQMADMGPIAEIAKKHNLAIIEDAAQAIGSKYKGKNVGELGTTATYSFFPTKNLGGYGDGGMIITNDDDIAETMRVIRVHGSKPKYYHHILGYNSRLDELQAGILNVKFPHLNTWSEARREKAAVYTELLNEKLGDLVVTPFVEEHNYHVFHQYTIQVPDRSGLQEFLKEKGIGSMIYYPKPLHLQPVFSELGYKEGDLPETEKAAETVLSLPMFPELKREQQEYVVEQIAAYFSNHPAKAKKETSYA